MRYRTLRRLHLWGSLLAAVPLVVLSLTGAMLVYAPELQRALDGETRSTGPVGASLSPTVIVDRVAQQRPDLDIWSISLTGEDAWTAWLSGGAGVLRIDPATGDILKHYFPKDTFQGWVTALHRRWLSEGPSARWVRHGVSAIALLFAVQLGLGLWLWLKPPKPLRRLSVSLEQGGRFAVIRLHQATGIATALILITVALTGIAMYWHTPMQKLVEWTTLSPVEHPEPPKDPALMPLADLDAGIALALRSVPNSELLHFRPPGGAGDPMIVGLSVEDQIVPTRVWVGDDPVRVLYTFDGSTVSLATKVWQLKYKIHIGDFAGPVVKALWVIVALLPTAFVVSGLWLYLGRRRRETRARGVSRAHAR